MIIRTEEECNAASNRIEELLEREEDLTEEERDELELKLVLVNHYEESYKSPYVPPGKLLSYLVQCPELNLEDLNLEQLLGTDMLAGLINNDDWSQVTLGTIWELSQVLGVEPSVFVAIPESV